MEPVPSTPSKTFRCFKVAKESSSEPLENVKMVFTACLTSFQGFESVLVWELFIFCLRCFSLSYKTSSKRMFKSNRDHRCKLAGDLSNYSPDNNQKSGNIKCPGKDHPCHTNAPCNSQIPGVIIYSTNECGRSQTTLLCDFFKRDQISTVNSQHTTVTVACFSNKMGLNVPFAWR